MKLTRILSACLTLVMVLCLFPMGAVEAEAAATVAHEANNATEAVLTNYRAQASNVDFQGGYQNLQTGAAMAQDGFLNKNKGLAVTWMVQAAEAGLYTFDPVYVIGHFGSINGGVYNMVWCVNDTRYYFGADITSNATETVSVPKGTDAVELYLDKGVNIVRMLPLADPDYVYQKVSHVKPDGTTCTAASYVNIYRVWIDSRLTVRQAAPLTVSFETNDRKNSEYIGNQFSSSTAESGYMQSGTTYMTNNLDSLPDYDSLSQANLSKIPYISYTLNAPEDGWYDMTMNLSLATFASYGNDGYLVVRVNGVNYKRWLRAANATNPYDTSKTWPFSDQNISVPLKKGNNTVTVTCAMGMKGGSDARSCEKAFNAYCPYTRIKKLTVYGGVTLASTKIDPTTVADAPLPATTLEAETYGAGFNGYTVSDTKLLSGNTASLTGLPKLMDLWHGQSFEKHSAPYAAFTVDVPTAGVYTVRVHYDLTAANGQDALNYYMSASVNDKFYDKARFEPAAALSRTAGYSELSLELDAGVNVIRLLPVLDGNPAAGVDIDKITIAGASKATGIAHDVTVLKAAEAAYRNGFTVSGDQLTGSTGAVTTYSALNSVNIKQIGYFAYTIDVPKDGYYDISANVGSSGAGMGSLVLLLNGKKTEIPVALGQSAQDNIVNLSRYFTAGQYTLVLTGVLGQESTMGDLTVCGGITLAETQLDPATLGVTPAVKEGGLVPGSAYTEQNFKLTNVPAGITLQEFESNFQERDQASFLNADGNALAANDPITVGCGVLYPEGTYYQVESLSQSGKHSVGVSYMLAMCNPIGRQVEYKSAMLMESSASNFTITGQFSGDVSIAVEVINRRADRVLHSLFIEVDGVASYINLKEGMQTVTLASGLSAGKHTIKVSKGTEAYRDEMLIHSLTYTGTLQKAQAANRRIEFLGDSITAGSGVFFQHCGYGPTHSYFSYANMTADALGADYYSVANGGWRFTSTYSPSASIATIYPYVSMHEDLGLYDHTKWQPDVVVIGLGTNDAIAARNNTTNYTEASFEENIFIMLDMVREKNPDAEIIWVYGMMLSEKKEWIQSAVEKYAQQDSKVHYLYCQPNTKGQGSHPDFEGSTTNAQILLEAVCEIMDWQLPTGTHATGDCGGVASCEFCRHNALTLPTHVYTDACDTQCDLTYVSESNGNTLECKHTRIAPHYSADCTSATCDSCGKEKAAQEAHSFVGNSCVNCDTERAALGFSGASVTLRDDLSLNFKFDSEKLADNGYESLYAVFTIGSRTVTVREFVMTETGPAFVCAGIAPHRMGEKVKATLYAVVDGEEVSAQAEYSIVDYCMNMLEKCQGDDYAKLRRLLVDLLQYGAAAQNYMNHRTDNLVTAGLSAEVLAEGSTEPLRQLVDSQNVRYSTVASPQVTWKGAGLYLVESVQVRLKFQAQDTQGLTVNVRLADQTYTMDASEFVAAGDKDTWYVYFDQLNAAQMSEVFQVTCYRNGVAVSDTLQYSIESYVRSKVFSSDSRLAALVIALMRYGDSANAYVK